MSISSGCVTPRDYLCPHKCPIALLLWHLPEQQSDGWATVRYINTPNISSSTPGTISQEAGFHRNAQKVQEACSIWPTLHNKSFNAVVYISPVEVPSLKVDLLFVLVVFCFPQGYHHSGVKVRLPEGWTSWQQRHRVIKPSWKLFVNSPSVVWEHQGLGRLAGVYSLQGLWLDTVESFVA